MAVSAPAIFTKTHMCWQAPSRDFDTHFQSNQSTNMNSTDRK